MPRRLLFLRLRAAEKALGDGRWDEAYRLAVAPDLRAHRRGAAVLRALAERFLERARTHFRAERFTEALMDLDRAEAGGVMPQEIAELRGQVRVVATEQQRKERSRRDRLDVAKKRIGDGSLEAGRRLLEPADTDDHAARELRNEIDQRAADAAHLVKAAEKLIAQGQLAGAAERLRRAKKLHPHDEAVMRAETKLCNQVFDAARTAMQRGRLGRAADELACLGDLGDALPARRELRDMLAVAEQAAHCVRESRYAEARRQVMSLDRLLPKAAWIGQTIKQLQHLTELRTELLAGPLAASVDSSLPRETPRGEHGALEDTVAIPRPVRPEPGSLPERLLLLVDGGGSFLLLRGGQTSIGRSASDNPAGIPILGDLAERHANVTRVDEDYFIFSTREIEVAGRRTKHELLRDGVRLVFGRRAKLMFRLPSRKSLTAVLDPSDTTKIPNDVRRVVLFHRHATIGPGRHAHIHCRHAQTPLVLFERDGGMWIRPCGSEVGRPAFAAGEQKLCAQALRIGEPVEIGGASLVLQPWTLSTPGRAI